MRQYISGFLNATIMGGFLNAEHHKNMVLINYIAYNNKNDIIKQNNTQASAKANPKIS